MFISLLSNVKRWLEIFKFCFVFFLFFVTLIQTLLRAIRTYEVVMNLDHRLMSDQSFIRHER